MRRLLLSPPPGHLPSASYSSHPFPASGSSSSLSCAFWLCTQVYLVTFSFPGFRFTSLLTPWRDGNPRSPSHRSFTACLAHFSVSSARLGIPLSLFSVAALALAFGQWGLFVALCASHVAPKAQRSVCSLTDLPLFFLQPAGRWSNAYAG